ncbi:MAG TPA: ABC transporter ATP-binding protein [Pyrinomonadaceae bacterium]|nr:ABC transporter ATP-binding protein [Pyrinomonadaceae bacterium]
MSGLLRKERIRNIYIFIRINLLDPPNPRSKSLNSSHPLSQVVLTERMLEVDKISVRYDGREVLRDVSFIVEPRQIVALLGANGAGKTTLIRAINNAVESGTGAVVLDGTQIDQISRREIARKIAVVAQENETKFPLTVLEFVLAGRFVHGGAFGWETDEDIKIADSVLAECDLTDFRDRLMNELSGGERQRVVLARALAVESEILLLDEPTANIDLAHQALMFRLVRARCRETNCSAIVITHDLNLAAEFADKIILLRNGEVFAQGGPREVLTRENLQSVFAVDVLLDTNPASGNVRVTTIF